jgi:hypothetical protein
MPADADSANALFARVERLGLRALSADAVDGLHRSIKLATRELVQFASLSSQISCLLEAGELRVNDFDLGGRVEGDLARDDFGGIFRHCRPTCNCPLQPNQTLSLRCCSVISAAPSVIITRFPLHTILKVVVNMPQKSKKRHVLWGGNVTSHVRKMDDSRM